MFGPALAALALGLLATPAFAQSACDTPQSHQFDFWVGKWEVFPKAAPQQKVADSLIEKLYAGCAIRENWMPLKGTAGGSFSTYIPARSEWRQTWISTGGFADFTGGFNGKSMVIIGIWPQPGHPTQMTRMTYTPLPDGDVEQAGETSDNRGASWQPSFDFIYRRAHP